MKITPSKNYKKPLYAIGIAAAMAAMALTGCTDPNTGKPVDYAGDIDVRPTETSEVRLDGEVADTDPTESSEFSGIPSESVNSVITAGIVPNNVDLDD